MRGLGELESSVMDVLWRSHDALKVRDVLERVRTGRPLAYTTVMTVLDNLHKKGWVRRERDGKAYRYRSSMTREAAAARALREVMDEFGDPDAVLMHFAQSASAHELAVLRRALDEPVPDR